MKSRLDRVISIATLAALLVAIFLLLRKPAPMAQPAQVPAAANSQSSTGQESIPKADQFDPAAKLTQTTQPSQAGGGHSAVAPQPSTNMLTPPSGKSEAHINSDAVSAAINKL